MKSSCKASPQQSDYRSLNKTHNNLKSSSFKPSPPCNDNLNYSFQDQSMIQNPPEQAQMLQRMSHLQCLIEPLTKKLISVQTSNQQANQVLCNKLNQMQRKLDRVCQALYDEKENLEPNLSCSKVRSGSGIHSSKAKNFFQDDDSLLSRLQSRKNNKNLMSIEERKRLIDKEIEKRLKGDVRKKAGFDSVQKYSLI